MTNQHPQWQQDVNRDSAIVDPVVTIEELSPLKPLRSARVDCALVFATAHGDLETYLPPARPSRRRRAGKRWTSVHTVDVGLHDTRAVLVMPSCQDAFAFEVTLSCSWRVADPAAFVSSGERNVPVMVQRIVDGLVRPVLRTYAMEDSHLAEKEAQDALAAAGPLGAGAGLDVRCAIQVTQDADALAHARELRAVAFARQKLEPEHALAMREDDLAAERTLAQVRRQHTIELETQDLGHLRETRRRRQDLELQELEAKKIQYYTYYLEQGGPLALAFQLAQRPEDTRFVVECLRQDQHLVTQNQLQVALQALGDGAGALEEHQLDEPRRLALNVVKEVLSSRLAQLGASPMPALDSPTAMPKAAVENPFEAFGFDTPVRPADLPDDPYSPSAPTAPSGS
jgi:hypothetical protein